MSLTNRVPLGFISDMTQFATNWRAPSASLVLLIPFQSEPVPNSQSIWKILLEGRRGTPGEPVKGCKS